MVLSWDECYWAADYVLDALAEIGETWSCLVGGMAAKLHGVDRIVKDLDIAILRPDMSEEEIQDALIDYDSDRFYLERPRNRTAEFFKLMYRIPNSTHVIKVDLLLSSHPDLEIPWSFHRNHFVEINGLQVAPLYFVLYHKLLGWEIRINSYQLWKQYQANDKDYPDIISLCDILYRAGESKSLQFDISVSRKQAHSGGYSQSTSTPSVASRTSNVYRGGFISTGHWINSIEPRDNYCTMRAIWLTHNERGETGISRGVNEVIQMASEGLGIQKVGHGE
ncbi:16461_t:CDS:2 [Acaulospora colombiana]|uniref:16461_t:CDS:1 n=1 Tax=Acaulospora colombiana TaxID=27376 RepID=A0ACA9NQX9_9GLOM|nr:16461_t:CDS:2 [Acaulospora colombiana]